MQSGSSTSCDGFASQIWTTLSRRLWRSHEGNSARAPWAAALCEEHVRPHTTSRPTSSVHSGLDPSDYDRDHNPLSLRLPPGKGCKFRRADTEATSFWPGLISQRWRLLLRIEGLDEQGIVVGEVCRASGRVRSGSILFVEIRRRCVGGIFLSKVPAGIEPVALFPQVMTRLRPFLKQHPEFRPLPRGESRGFRASIHRDSHCRHAPRVSLQGKQNYDKTRFVANDEYRHVRLRGASLDARQDCASVRLPPSLPSLLTMSKSVLQECSTDCI